MKTYLVTALAVSSMAAVAGVAVAQRYDVPVGTFDAALTPAKAGTKKRPKASKVRLKLAFPKEARLTTDQVVFHLPGHVKVSGSGFAFCPSTTLDTTKNPKKCPKGSRVGAGTATATFGTNQRIDFDVTIFAGSRDELGIWLQSTNLPIRKAARGVISKSGSPFNQKLTIDLPRELQQHLNAWVHLTAFDVTLGASNGKRGKKRRHLVRTVGCPKDGLHRHEARIRFVANPNPPPVGEALETDTSACR